MSLFIILIVGLLFISTLSILLTEYLRNEFFEICKPYMNEGYLTFKYEEPQETSEIMDVIEKHPSVIYSLYLITEKAYLNNPYYYEIVTDYKPLDSPSEMRITAPDEPGIVGYMESEYVVENMHMISGEYPDFRKAEIDATVITKSLESFIKNGLISVNGKELSLSGIVSDYTNNSLFFSERNVVTSISNYEKLGAESIIVLVHFYNYPTKSFLNDLYLDLDSLGNNTNTFSNVAVFSWIIIFEYVFSVLKYILILLIAFATLMLTFNCWLSTQQSLYSVYYICGMKDSRCVLLRLLQIMLITTPIYVAAVVLYMIITSLGYKTFTYEMSPILIIINYIVIASVSCIISLIQNKNISGYNSLKNI